MGKRDPYEPSFIPLLMVISALRTVDFLPFTEIISFTGPVSKEESKGRVYVMMMIPFNLSLSLSISLSFLLRPFYMCR